MKNFNEFISENEKNKEETYVTALVKMKAMIKTCRTTEQVDAADNYFDLWKKKWEDELANHDVHELVRMIEDKYEETYVE